MCIRDRWKTEIKDCLMKTIMRQNEEKENLTLNHWKDVYKEDVIQFFLIIIIYELSYLFKLVKQKCKYNRTSAI